MRADGLDGLLPSDAFLVGHHTDDTARALMASTSVWS
jgi:hypothetical protein